MLLTTTTKTQKACTFVILTLIPLCFGAWRVVKITTNCEQKLTFFLKLHYNNDFWIGEDLYGECGQSNLIQVFLAGEKVIVKKTELAQFEKWDWIEQAKKAIRTETPYLLLPNSNQVIDNEAIGVKLRAPKYNNRLFNKFSDEFSENCATQWNQQMKEEGVDTPQTWDLDLDLAYYHPNGLYFNYQIEKVFIFPESNYLLLMTKNNLRCASGDTMNGFLIFKFKVVK
jgi:hypothetical protein